MILFRFGGTFVLPRYSLEKRIFFQISIHIDFYSRCSDVINDGRLPNVNLSVIVFRARFNF